MRSDASRQSFERIHTRQLAKNAKRIVHVLVKGVRTILVPPDIVAVPRVSPVRVRKKTVWRRRPDGEHVERAGGREWFSDRLFVESPTRQTRAVYGTSMTAHASCMIGLIVVLVTQPAQVPMAKVGSSLVMPAMLSTMPVLAASPAPRSREEAPPKPVPQQPAATAPETVSDSAAAPVDAPSGIEPETSTATSAGGSESGIDGGVGYGVAGGTIAGAPASGGLTSGPLRLTAGMEPPRKIKDVRPIYPQGALSDQARGTVVIEATVGVDGLVKDAAVIQSVPLLDQAALDAVRQWQFVPSRLNGVPLAVIITVIVQFAIH